MAISRPKVIKGKAKKKGNSTEDIKKIVAGLGAAKDAKVEAKAKAEATAARKKTAAQKKAEAKKKPKKKTPGSSVSTSRSRSNESQRSHTPSASDKGNLESQRSDGWDWITARQGPKGRDGMRRGTPRHHQGRRTNP